MELTENDIQEAMLASQNSYEINNSHSIPPFKRQTSAETLLKNSKL